MFIQTEETPNPNALKFLPGKEILEGPGVEVTSAENQNRVPLARKLFRISGIKSLFFGSDFISVTKSENTDWAGIKADIFGTLMDYFTLHDRVEVKEETGSTSSTSPQGEEDDISKEIKELLDTKVRPAVAGDGGDITFERFEDGIVYVKMKGACSGCPRSTLTLKSGIENMLRYYIPEVQEVRPVNDEEEI
ncbi:MAG: NifU family protein [bacterium]|nr:NifU family protein [bacterium]